VAIAILLGGNPHSQEKFAEYITNDEENIFILSLKSMLFEAFDFVKKTNSQKNKLNIKLIQITSRIEELGDVKEKTRQHMMEIKKAKETSKNYEEDIALLAVDENENPATYTTNKLTVTRAIDNTIIILKFLQLLCENHNNTLQNALRSQSNRNGKVKGNAFDLCHFLAKNFE
jgi:hypothetical protein